MTATSSRNPQGARPVVPGAGLLRPLTLAEVGVRDGFWGRRQKVNGEVTLDHALSWMERVGWVDNFRAVAAGRMRGERGGREFSDSEIYKLMEAMAWEVGRSRNVQTEAALRALTSTVGAAQGPDGYLNTAFGQPGQPARYSDLEWGHELYCYGHLIQAGVARARVTGADELVEIARRAADHVCREFGPGANEGMCGHPEIEMALVELARLTGEARYLDQAAVFVQRRGHQRLADIPLGRAYFQDDVPVRAATVLRGHAVRALYLASGAVDVAVETGDAGLLAAVERQWEATVARRTYLTGGMGSHHEGEAFGDDFVLPPDRAYSETCAAVASVMLSWRLLLATGNPRYADLIERTLYNVLATSTAPDGRAFFYTNTLYRRHAGPVPPAAEMNPRPESGLRAPWFAVSCCPTNIARLFASLAGYLATADDTGIQLHQYASCDIHTRLGDGATVGLAMRTGYPDHAAVSVEVTESRGQPWSLSLRVPGWADSGAILVDPTGARRPVGAGTVTVTHRFAVGDRVSLELPIRARWVRPDPRIDAIRGTVAVERGPLVLCLESVDLPAGRHVGEVRVDASTDPTEANGQVRVTGELVKVSDEPWPYAGTDHDTVSSTPERVEVPLLPYYAWATRGPSTMRVWLPEHTRTNKKETGSKE
ncbi:MAG TPA: beta-L-arabinofuranosidase domain-containing protein [Actinomycetes bacterium]|nr:beta-L-arabinofuranosidase domain-containing protein [Actinomycetes bacterium]